MVFKTLLKFAVGKRVPLIKFRKGDGGPATASAGAASNQASASSPAAANKGGRASNAIEDWELPPRYHRKPIDLDEMEYINRGGPA